MNISKKRNSYICCMKAKKSYENGGKVRRRSTPGTAARDRMIAARKEEEYKKRIATAKARMNKRLEEDKAARKYSGSVPAGKKVREYKKGGFPDLTGDGKVTMADILKGRKVFKKGGMMPKYKYGGKACGCGKMTACSCGK